MQLASESTFVGPRSEPFVLAIPSDYNVPTLSVYILVSLVWGSDLDSGSHSHPLLVAMAHA
jgi:hypothetical protein